MPPLYSVDPLTGKSPQVVLDTNRLDTEQLRLCLVDEKNEHVRDIILEMYIANLRAVADEVHKLMKATNLNDSEGCDVKESVKAQILQAITGPSMRDIFRETFADGNEDQNFQWTRFRRYMDVDRAVHEFVADQCYPTGDKMYVIDWKGPRPLPNRDLNTCDGPIILHRDRIEVTNVLMFEAYRFLIENCAAQDSILALDF